MSDKEKAEQILSYICFAASMILSKIRDATELNQ